MNVVDAHRERIDSLLPGADIRLTGSSLIPDLDAGDVDLVVLVDEVAPAAEALASIYPPLYPEQWRDDWAAFREPGPPQVDLVVTRIGTLGDAHHRLAWERLISDPELLDAYRRLNRTEPGYEERKAEFFDGVVSERLR